jgi:N utilization substance protein B
MSYHRHKSREFALQMLFEWDLSRKEPAQIRRLFWRAAHVAEETRKFANHLFEATVRESPEIDSLVASLSDNWRLDRLPPVDRNILRMALYEIRVNHKDTPPKVAIDEALKLAKKFSSAESPAFLNGILGAALKKIESEPNAEA